MLCLYLWLFSFVFEAWEGSREALGDALGIIEGQLGHLRGILDKSREIMITCDVYCHDVFLKNDWFYIGFAYVLQSARITDLGLWKVRRDLDMMIFLFVSYALFRNVVDYMERVN